MTITGQASRRVPPPRPFFVGIAGGTASGKTSLARWLSGRLGKSAALCISMDNYYRTPSGGAKSPLRVNFDTPRALDIRLLAGHLEMLADGRTVALPAYDFTRHRRLEAARPAGPRPFVIVEGLFVLSSPEIRKRMDLGIYVECADDVRLARRVLRDCAERGRDVSEVITRYLRHARPAHERYVRPSRAHADFVWDQAARPRYPREILELVKSAPPGR